MGQPFLFIVLGCSACKSSTKKAQKRPVPWKKRQKFHEMTLFRAAFVEKFTDYITAEEYMGFRKAVCWAEFPLEEAEEGLKNSFICCLRLEDKPIALGRVIWDHGYVVYIADIIVLPEYQGNGYGRMVMEKIMSMINGWLKPGYKMMVSLCSAKGKEEFYTKFGFVKRPDENYGCGMCQWLGISVC